MREFPKAQALYERWADAMAAQGVGVDGWTDLDDHERIAWNVAAGGADAPDAASEPAKVIIVTEPRPGAAMERRYRANSWDLTSEGDAWQLDAGNRAAPGAILLDVAAAYAPGAWLSVCEDGATVPDSTTVALGIARAALTEIRDAADKRTDAEFFAIRAATALNDIWNETEL